MFAPKRQKTSNETKRKLLINFNSLNTDLEYFPHPLIDDGVFLGSEPKTLDELTMMQLSGTLRSKVKWYEKYKDQTIRNKWKQEATEQTSLSEKKIDYVLDELEYYDSIRDGSMQMSAVDGVWQSDEVIPADVKEALMTYVKKLEDVPDDEKDWHPGTNQQVLDLVHPSLFCYVNEVTTVINNENRTINVDNALEYIGDGETVDFNLTPESEENQGYKSSLDYSRSKKFQWLPSEFNVSNDGQVKIESYINNLHPVEYKELYHVIEQIFGCFIPLFNKALTDLTQSGQKPNRITVDSYNWYGDDDSAPQLDEDGEPLPIVLPEIQDFQMPSPSETETEISTIDLCGKRLQVIVKLANIILTPDNPTYWGGSWHIEGMKNEHIVATGIYYYHNTNITQSNLHFRTVMEKPHSANDDPHPLRCVYDMGEGDPLNQGIGDVITQQDRCIVFPNIHQHCVGQFELEDPTKQGERKILVFFLVDPSVRILSTANVPPQQSHWLVNMLRPMSPFAELPTLVVDKILSYVDFPMSMKEAKEHRAELMEERKYFISENNRQVFERPFAFCEH